MSRSVLVTAVTPAGPMTIFSGTAEGEERSRRFVSRIAGRAPLAGEVWNIDGRVTRHAVHGEQVVVERARLERPSGRLIVQFLSSERFEGVGGKSAAKLWQVLGEDLYGMLADADETAIAAALGGDARARRQAASVVEGWCGLVVEMDVVAWMDRHAVEPAAAVRIIGCYGGDAARMLAEDPYRLVVFGAQWDEADRVARSIGMAEDDAHRLVAAVEHCLQRRFARRGDTWCPREDLLAEVVRLLGAGLAEAALAAAAEAGASIVVPGGWQGAGPAALEGLVAREVAQRCAIGHVGGGLAAAAETTAASTESLAAHEEACGFVLNEGQRAAVRLAASARFGILTGGAGTGKTAVLRAIAAIAGSAGETVMPMALSGRAALRVTEATGLQARTIAGFLQIHERSRDTLPTRPFLIVDEASMVDVTLLYRILSVLEERGRLLLVGDPAQLPPIGPGLTLHSLVDAAMVPRVELTEIVRQAAETGIPQAGRSVRSGEVPAALDGDGFAPGVVFVERSAEHVAECAIAMRAAEPGQVQIVVANKGTETGGSGTRRINALCRARIGGAGPAFGGFHVGEPVIWTRNDHDLGLMNGELGVVGGAATGGKGLTVEFAGRTVALPVPKLRDLEPAYAITVHKAQGSAFDTVIVPIAAHRLLDRTLIYTAATRARRKVVFVGDRRAFEEAVRAEPSSTRRRSALHLHLAAASWEMDGERTMSSEDH